MPLYIADYLKDTTHLGALESGAYLHLIMDYWANGKLPDDDKKLARIAKMTDREWKAAKATIQGFFQDGWTHKRVDAEITEAARIAQSNAGKARGAANKRWSKHPPNMPEASSEQCLEHTSSNAPECTLHTSQEERKKDAAVAAPETDEVQFFRRGKELYGPSAGGLLRKLLDKKGGSIPLARAALEQASTKQDGREYLGAIIRGREQPANVRTAGRSW